jgi:hypothetical protein
MQVLELQGVRRCQDAPSVRMPLVRRLEFFGIWFAAAITASITGVGATHSNDVLYAWGDNSHGQVGTTNAQTRAGPNWFFFPVGSAL